MGRKNQARGDGEMKTLEQMQEEVGHDIYSRWKQRAEREFTASPFMHRGEPAHHTYVYAVIFHQYDNYIKSQDIMVKRSSLKGGTNT